MVLLGLHCCCCCCSCCCYVLTHANVLFMLSTFRYASDNCVFASSCGSSSKKSTDHTDSMREIEEESRRVVCRGTAYTSWHYALLWLARLSAVCCSCGFTCKCCSYNILCASCCCGTHTHTPTIFISFSVGVCVKALHEGNLGCCS